MNIQPKDTSRGHLYFSLAKSLLRIAAAGFLIEGHLVIAGTLFMVAEALGIAEELV